MRFPRSIAALATAVRTRILGAALIGVAALSGCSSGSNVNIAFSQPGDTQTTDYAIAYVKRTLPVNANTKALLQDDLTQRTQFFAPADLFVREPSSQGGIEVNITSRIAGVHDIKDVDVSSDGKQVIFAMRTVLQPKPQKNFAPPFWTIYQYTLASDKLVPLVPLIDQNADGTPGHQYISPHYLPDGTILFASTLQQDAGRILINEDKETFPSLTEDVGTNEESFVLHVMDATLANVKQITFNASHDVDATVLANGRVMYSRWDRANGNNGIALYTVYPDGTDTQLLYGTGSHVTSATNPQGNPTCPAGLDCAVQFVHADVGAPGRRSQGSIQCLPFRAHTLSNPQQRFGRAPRNRLCVELTADRHSDVARGMAQP